MDELGVEPRVVVELNKKNSVRFSTQLHISINEPSYPLLTIKPINDTTPLSTPPKLKTSLNQLPSQPLHK